MDEDISRHWIALVSDYQMNDGDGVRLIREMKKLGIQVGRWILTSGVSKLDQNVQTLIAEYSDVVFIKKPYLGEQIISLIFGGNDDE